MPYTATTFGDLKSQLADRLDEARVFWIEAELGLLIKEAMRTWNVMTGYWRKRVQFQTVASQAFYSLPAIASLASTHSFTLTDRDLIVDMEYSLIEPITTLWAAPWAGTDMFTMAQFANALQRRRNQFLLDAGVYLTHDTIAVAPPPIGRVPLPETYIDVRRAAWKDSDDVYSPIFRDDAWAADSFEPTWTQQPARPRSMGIATVPQITLQLMPVPLASGELDVVVVETGTDLDPTSGVVMGIQDDFAWVVRYGAMADLLSQEGEGRDPLRAEYCEKRYQQGVSLARVSAGLMQVQVNAVPVRADSLSDWDTFEPEWQNSSDKPKRAALPGWSMLVLNPVPDAIYGISADAIVKAPVPSVDADLIEAGKEDLEAILNLAEHAGSFKQGGAEFSQSMALYQVAEQSARVYNSRIEEFSIFSKPLQERARQEQTKVPTHRPTPAELVEG